MKTIIDTKSVKANATKKAPKKSESVLNKIQANKNWKENTFSMSALVRYAKGEGKADLEHFIKATNTTKGTKITFGQCANIKNIVKHATQKELFTKDGEAKTRFSYWLLLQTVGRLAKAEIEANKKINK